MIKSFRDGRTEALYNGQRVREFQAFERQAVRRLQILDDATSPGDLMALPSNRLEALAGDRAGQHSIRVNRRWRLCFEWLEGEAQKVEIVDVHRG